MSSALRTGLQLGKSRVVLGSQDDGSGRLTRWYQRMGFSQVGINERGFPQLEAPINSGPQRAARDEQGPENGGRFVHPQTGIGRANLALRSVCSGWVARHPTETIAEPGWIGSRLVACPAPGSRRPGVLQRMEAVKKTEKKDESGTEPNTRSKDGRYRIKITSLRELFVYDQRERFRTQRRAQRALLGQAHTMGDIDGMKADS